MLQFGLRNRELHFLIVANNVEKTINIEQHLFDIRDMNVENLHNSSVLIVFIEQNNVEICINTLEQIILESMFFVMKLEKVEIIFKNPKRIQVQFHAFSLNILI